MRITGGTHRGRTLFGPGDDTIRPTADKVRQAIFTMLNARGAVAGAVVLDAFCGTGAMGIEALSHGAARSFFFDKSSAAVALCRRNLVRMGFEQTGAVSLRDALAPGPAEAAADLIFIDPPYHKNLALPALQALHDRGWVAPGAWIVVETALKDDLEWPGMEIMVEKRYGDTRIRIAVSGGQVKAV